MHLQEKPYTIHSFPNDYYRKRGCNSGIIVDECVKRDSCVVYLSQQLLTMKKKSNSAITGLEGHGRMRQT